MVILSNVYMMIHTIQFESLQCGAPKIAKLVNITPMSLWFMVRK